MVWTLPGPAFSDTLKAMGKEFSRQAKKEKQAAEEEVRRQEDRAFTAALEELVEEGEALRLKRMQQHRTRSFISMTFGIISVMAGAGAFGWFFLMEADLARAVLFMILAIAAPLALNFWAERPLALYRLDHKNIFMPRMAKALGGLRFYPRRGVSVDLLAKTGVVPAHDVYSAEDCFMGRYKGVKVLFSEGRLTRKRGSEPVFNGIFALLEIPDEKIEGHTVVTADMEMVKRCAGKRWKSLEEVNIQTSNPDWNRFRIFSSKPASASLLIGETLLKELSEAADIFGKAPLTAVLFRKKYIFMMIPYDGDMFEASDIFVPVSTKQYAVQCKKEIERLLEIIDVFDLYQPGEGAKPFAT